MKAGTLHWVKELWVARLRIGIPAVNLYTFPAHVTIFVATMGSALSFLWLVERPVKMFVCLCSWVWDFFTHNGNPAMEKNLVGSKRSIDIFSVFPPLDVKLSFRVVLLVRNTCRTGIRQRAEKYSFMKSKRETAYCDVLPMLIVTSLVTVRQSHRAASGREAVRTPKAAKSTGKTSRQQKITGGRWRRYVRFLTSVRIFPTLLIRCISTRLVFQVTFLCQIVVGPHRCTWTACVSVYTM